MPGPDDIHLNLSLQFDKFDELHVNESLRIFGRDTSRIFKEIDVIRRKQIELATEHISLESIDDMSLPVIQTSSGDIEDEYKRNLVYFNKKEIALKSLMSKLDKLGEIMNDFHERSDLNPHTMSNGIQETTTAPTTPSYHHVGNMSGANGLKNKHNFQTSSAENTIDLLPKTNPRESIPIISYDQTPS